MNLKKLFYDKKKKDKKTTLRLFRVPVYKCSFDNEYRKKYLFGILFSKKTLFQKTEDIKNRTQKDEIVTALNVFSCRIEKEISDLKIQNNALEKEIMKFNAVEMCSDDRKKDVEKNAIFLAGSMAIAEYTVKIHSCQPEAFDIFADVSNFEQWNHLRSLHKNASKIIFPISSFETMSKIRKYKNKIFVLGNSEHHTEVLKMACATKGEPNRWCILHEPFLIGLFWRFITDDFNKFMIQSYPELKDQIEKSKDVSKLFLDNHCYFIRPLIQMTGIENFILYSKKNQETFLLEEMEDKDRIKTFSLPLPIQKIENLPQLKNSFPDTDYLIGTFGMPNDLFKRVSLLIQAVHLLNQKKNVKVKLLIAGANVEFYKETVPNELRQNVIFLSDVRSEDWLSLLNSVDLAVQLRENAFSFSSACVAEVLGIGKRVLVTKGMVDSEWEKAGYVRFVAEGLNAEEMAEILKDEIQNKYTPEESDEIYQAYSFENNCAKIKTIVEKYA